MPRPRRFPHRFAAALLAALPFAAPVTAQSSLGFTSGELSLGQSSHADEDLFFRGMIDVAITPYHGLQGNLSYDTFDTGDIGTIAGFLYMTPQPGQKYGLSLSVSDVNDRSLTYVQFGAAGIFALGETVDLELRGGIGVMVQNDVDWLTAGIGLHWQPDPDWRLYAQYDIAEFQEPGLDALGHVATLGVRYSPAGAPWGVFAEVSHDILDGVPGAQDETTVRVGFNITWGGSADGSPAFRVSDPARQLLRRGLY